MFLWQPHKVKNVSFHHHDFLHCRCKVALPPVRNLLEDTLMVLESSPSLLVTVQVTVRFTLGMTVMLWVALPLE